MVKWKGKYMSFQMFLRRKLNPLGRKLKIVCDDRIGVCFRMVQVGNVTLMKEKEFYTEYGTTSAKTLRLMQPLFGIGRVCLRNNWFG